LVDIYPSLDKILSILDGFFISVAVRMGIVEFGQGSTLPTEDGLAAQLGVSRNAWREAMKVLASKGLLEIKPKTGTRVLPTAEWNLLDRDVLAWHAHSELKLTRAFELVEFRLVVEPRASFLAARRSTPAEIDVIEEGCALLESCIGRPDLVAARDIAFHRSIHQASHNALLNHLGSLTASLTICTYWVAPTSPFVSGGRQLQVLAWFDPLDPFTVPVAVPAMLSGPGGSGRLGAVRGPQKSGR